MAPPWKLPLIKTVCRLVQSYACKARDHSISSDKNVKAKKRNPSFPQKKGKKKKPAKTDFSLFKMTAY
jgi:hypothetical protein